MDKLSQNTASDQVQAVSDELQAPDLQDTLKSTLDGVHFQCKQLGSEVPDRQVLQQLILDVTKTPEDVLDSMTILGKREYLLTKLKALSKEKMSELEIYTRLCKTRSTDEDFRQALEDTAAKLKPSQSKESPYRVEHEDGMPDITTRFAQYRDKELPNDETEALADFMEKEYLTWLDIALLQQGTRLKLGRACNLDDTRELAQKLFGESSRVERYLDRFKALPPISPKDFCRMATPVTLAPVVAFLYAIADVLQSRDLYDFDKAGLSLMFGLMAVMFAVVPALTIKEGFINPEKEGPANKTRKYLSKKYFKMVAPPEVRSFVALMTEVYEGMDKLRGISDAEERQDMLEKLNQLAAQAQRILQTNKALFEERPLSAKFNGESIEPVKTLSSRPSRPVSVATRVRVAEVVDAVLEDNESDVVEADTDVAEEMLLESNNQHGKIV